MLNLTSGDKAGMVSLYCERWITNTNAFSSSQKWMAGDFDGNGIQDVAVVFNDNGLASVDVYISNGTSFTCSRWATRQGGYWDAQKWLAGRFSSDNRTDLCRVFNDNGAATIDVFVSSGSSFSWSRWATRQGGYWDAQKWLSGDFNGNGITDLCRVFNDNGYATIDVVFSNGSSFYNYTRWATRQGGFGDAQQWMSADFDNNGYTDLSKVFSDNGYASADVHFSNGSSFYNYTRWATQKGGFSTSQIWMAGNLNGDAYPDLIKSWGGSGLTYYDAHLSNGSSFPDWTRWGNKVGSWQSGSKWLIGDFDNDGDCELVDVFGGTTQVAIDLHNLL
ncbi:MAG: hypothetical protein JW768_03435 [Chitinispirillaceae bacterium]|nr:hypothetical protein [Chitinispirillaceae bacterium]